MLVISPKRLMPAHINTTILQGDDGSYYYLHRDLYDQLTIIWDTFDYGDTIDQLCSLLGVRLISQWPDNVMRFYNEAPAPLRAAAPYIMLVKEAEKLETLEDMCGALSVMSMTLDFRKMLKVDRSIRASVSFSLHIREEYRVSWDRFFQENPEFGTIEMPMPAPKYNQIETPTSTVVQDAETYEEEEVTVVGSEANIDWSFLTEAVQDVVSVAASATVTEESGTNESNEGGTTIQSGFSALAGI